MRLGIGIAGALTASLWAAALLVPDGWLPWSPLPGLPEPGLERGPAGAPVATVDAGAWAAALEAARLPVIPALGGVEHEPVRRLVENSRGWTERGDGDALGEMGIVLLSLELHGPAIDYLRAAGELGERRAEWAYFEGAALQHLGRQAAALEALERARGLDPGYGVTAARIGELHMGLGDLDAAARAFQDAARGAPSPSLGHMGLARVALERGDHAGALAELDRVVQLTPRDFRAHRLRARALVALGRPEEAERAAARSNALPAYRGWLSFDPRLEDAQWRAGTQRSVENALSVAVQRRDLGAAKELAEELLRRLPESPQALNTAAQALGNAGELGRALSLSRRAVELDPGTLTWRVTLGEVALAAGQLEDAERSASALCADPGLRAMGHQLKGRIRSKQGRGVEAADQLRKAIATDPEEVAHRLMLANVLLRDGRKEEAVGALEEAAEVNPLDGRAARMLQQLRSR